jgi:protein ImuB
VPRYLSVYLPPREDGAPRRLDAVTDWHRRFTPLAAADPPDGVMLDVAGAAHLFGGEAAMLAHVENELARRGISARGAIAPTPEAANALARFGEAPPARRMIADHEDRAARERMIFRALSNLPVRALRLDDATSTALAQSGLKRIGDIWLRPRAPIAARFGAQVFATLDAMMGRTKSAISPRFEAPAYIAERRFAEGILARDHIEATVAALARDLSAMLERHGEGARKLVAALFRVDGKVMHFECTTSRPQRDAKVIARLFREKIEALAQKNESDPLDAGYGFDLIRLGVMQAEKLRPEQKEISDTDAPPHDPRALEDFLDRMRARFGVHSVLQFVENDTHVPEFALAASFSPLGERRPSRAQNEARGTFFDLGAASLTGSIPDYGERGSARPVRLFEKAEPVEALALVPDGPPLRFRWRRAMHEVAAYEGPERIAPEWWKGEETALTRDYFRVEDTNGRRFWLYREGLYERETQRPRWFMHGVFG